MRHLLCQFQMRGSSTHGSHTAKSYRRMRSLVHACTACREHAPSRPHEAPLAAAKLQHAAKALGLLCQAKPHANVSLWSDAAAQMITQPARMRENLWQTCARSLTRIKGFFSAPPSLHLSLHTFRSSLAALRKPWRASQELPNENAILEASAYWPCKHSIIFYLMHAFIQAC